MTQDPNTQNTGCLSWVVCLVAFLADFVILGIDHNFGAIIGSLVNDFNSTEGDIAWIGSVHSSAMWIAAFTALPLANYFEFGLILLLGTFVATISFGIALLSSSPPWHVVTCGIFAGIGLGLTYTPANVVCPFYFEKKRTLSLVLSNSGRGVGILSMAYVLNLSMGSCRWKGYIYLCTSVPPLVFFLGLMVWIFPSKKEHKETRLQSMLENEVNTIYDFNKLAVALIERTFKYILSLQPLVMDVSLHNKPYYFNILYFTTF